MEEKIEIPEMVTINSTLIGDIAALAIKRVRECLEESPTGITEEQIRKAVEARIEKDS